MTKIDVFSGFLGAGKTTLIKKLLKEGYNGEKLVLIENEFGEIGIDGGFMKDAGIEPEEVTYINAHGTSTPLNDKYETMAIKTAFGDASKKVIVSSTKGHTGHLLGAAGGIEAVACVKAIEKGIVPPTIGYKVPDEECDLDIVPNQARKIEVKYAMSNSLGFGGHNSSIIFKKYEGR